jgi:glycosyltransferase involved in cell wall biosynthesis
VPKVLIIADHRINRSPSQRYRFEQYLNYFKENNFEWEISEIITEKDDKIFYNKGNYILKAYVLLKSLFIRLKDLKRVNQFDIVFIQREALSIGSSYFEKQFFKRNKVVFDFDDSIWLLDTSPENKKFSFLKNPEKTKTNITHSHVAIAGNTYLSDYAKQYNKNTIIIPTTIDTNFHIPKPELRNKNKIVIGWSGSISTIKHFEMLVPVLKQIQNKYANQVEFHVIGQGTYINNEIQVVSKNWSSKTEVDDLNAIDIGIMPLPDNEWVKGKCGLKGLSYMACGVATIMSNVGVNSEIIEHGKNGFLADNEQDWYNYISQLIENKTLRQQLGNNGRETVVNNYSVNAHKDTYLRVLKSLIKL